MNCLYSRPWVFFIHHLPVFAPFLPLIVLRTRTDILSFVYFLQIIIASHIHAIYNHSLEERRRVEPGNTPVKKRTSSQSQVQLLSKQSFCLLIIWSACIQLTYDIFLCRGSSFCGLLLAIWMKMNYSLIRAIVKRFL